ncbi:MAG: TonB-dependent receptor [Bacteroidales bacterium]
MRANLLLTVVLLSSGILAAQQHSLSGYVRDASSGESLIGATLYLEPAHTGTTTNAYGFYSLSAAQGVVKVRCSFTGYNPQELEFVLTRDTVITFQLEPVIQLREVQVTATHTHSSVQSTRMSTIELPVAKIRELPQFLGESDVLKTIQLLPGVQAGAEGTSGYYVRGGSPDQNLMLLDGVPVYNANHLFGFFSVFNPDAINHIELVKGGFPARYGGRLSSVLDIRMKEGNMKDFRATGSIGIMASKLTVEGPLQKDKTSFIVSGRRFYLDHLLRPLFRISTGNQNQSSGYYFSDVNAKVNHIFSSRDRLFLSLYTGNDQFYEKRYPMQYLYEGEIYESSGRANLGWGNITTAMRWNRQFSGKLFGNATLTYSNYNFRVNQNIRDFTIENDQIIKTHLNQEYLSGIQDLSARYDLDYLPGNLHHWRAGGGITRYTFRPGASVNSSQYGEAPPESQQIGHNDINATHVFAYLEDEFDIIENLKVNAGARVSWFNPGGKNYFALEPRVSMRYLFSDQFALKASYARMSQHIHLLTNNNIGLPTDLWVPATRNVPVMNSSQYAAGATWSLSGMYHLSLESYYKTMNNVIEYREGASFLANYSNWEGKVESGKAWGYGAELFLEKRTGILTGWIGYTWAKSDRQFPSINSGQTFPYKYDRRHDLSVVLNYKFENNWNVSLTWVYGTGNAITMPTVEYLGLTLDGTEEKPVQSYNSRNQFRAAPYHRLDIGFNNVKKTRWGERTWSFGLYNAYNRVNPFYYAITRDYNTGNKVLERTSLFPVLPSVNYTFKIGN